MSYGEGVLVRMMTPGFAVMVVGALAVFLSGLLVKNVPAEKQWKAGLIVKGAGTAMVALGAVMVFLS